MDTESGSGSRTDVNGKEEEVVVPVGESEKLPPVTDPVDESNKGSFPASDPPSWWAGP